MSHQVDNIVSPEWSREHDKNLILEVISDRCKNLKRTVELTRERKGECWKERAHVYCCKAGELSQEDERNEVSVNRSVGVGEERSCVECIVKVRSETYGSVGVRTVEKAVKVSMCNLNFSV
jgi:hypothetical protein